MKNIWIQSLKDAQNALDNLIKNEKLLDQCTLLGSSLAECFQKGNKVLICGNGGSHCDALHFAEEWTGRYRGNRKALPVIALGEASHTTCVSNDFGFEFVFSRQVEAFAKKDDLFIGISTSGNSPNVIRAIESANKNLTQTWALLGKDGGKIKDLAQHSLIVPGMTTDRIQELHMLLLHISIEHAERILFPENYR